jgi:phosphate starvation-inducible protein PhoH and related proteins
MATKTTKKVSGKVGNFHIEFKNDAQRLAWAAFQQHDVLFMIGLAGSGKTHLACAFAVEQLLSKAKKKIVITRPIVESGESLGYLPGEFEEKVHPYMMPIYDCLDRIVGRDNGLRDKVNLGLEVAPLAYMRGRMQPHSALVYTPNGAKTFGEVKTGDMVIGSDGKPTAVTGVYPHGVKQMYRIIFSDNTETRCGSEHLWATMTLNEKRHNKGFTIKTTKEIIKTVKDKYNRKIHRVPVLTGPVEFIPQPVEIDPYLLGCLLGDGCFGGHSVKLSTVDHNLLDECTDRLPEGNTLVYCKKCDYRIKTNGNNKLRQYLTRAGLIHTKSYNKFVPEEYKYNSVEVRLLMLQGLMDTDGTIGLHHSGKCRIQYCSTSEQLAKDVMFLVRSLGGYTYCRLRKYGPLDEHLYNGKIIKHIHSAYIVDIMMDMCPFKLSRKAIKHTNLPRPTKMIKNIVPDGEEMASCIQVSNHDGLYITDDFIVTHNTFHDSICIFDEAQNATKMQLKLFLTRFGDNSKIIITGDPSQSDLPTSQVALMDVMHRLSGITGIGVVQFKANSIVRHPLVGDIIRHLEM